MIRSYAKSEIFYRRLNIISKVLGKNRCYRTIATGTHDGSLKIGKTEVQIRTPEVPQYVPYNYLPKELSQSTIRHLQWIAQKDVLGQDVFLIGPPGPLRRIIAMQYLELTRKEAEYISLSRDTTENDLKQRREMRSGSSFYIDQCAVKAAVEGRVLVLEGIEKAERNVLPALNNLLENREMQLDDGRFLMNPDRYDQLLKENSKEKLDEWKLVRVNENFRVFALGLPVPKYKGNPLDPPLRSRFQARDVHYLSFSDQLQALYAQAPSVESTKIAEILSCATTLVTQDSSNLGLPDFPLDNLQSALDILEKVPTYPTSQLLEMLYPYHLLLNKEGTSAVQDVYNKFNIPKHQNFSQITLKDIKKNDMQAEVTVVADTVSHKFNVPCSSHNTETNQVEFISTDFHDKLLIDLLLTHSTKDFCIIGSKGCGKTSMVNKLTELLSYRTEPLLMYQDMTSRDLLQQRFTLSNGDTQWKYSPLIQACIDGSVAVLDGLNRVNAGTLSILQRLVHDREITLHDGTRLLRHDKYDSMRDKLQIDDKEMRKQSVYRIHPSFRIIALAEPPKQGVSSSNANKWLDSELLTLFMYHHMPPLSHHQELKVLNGMVPGLNSDIAKYLLRVTEKLRNSKDANSRSLASSLSTRQLIRICKRLDKFSSKDNYKQYISDAVHKACLSRFLPHLTRSSLTDALSSCELPSEPAPTKHLTLENIDCKVENGKLKIENVVYPVYGTNKSHDESQAKVPEILFYDNAQHLMVMRDMLQDYALGEHILLVGNQGVGKNKVVDRFLQLLNKPREYLQLHRDTTVQSLTVQPTVKDGIIVFEDSALVRAVRNGHALVVDEADKAPIHVTCVLKSLLESGRATLADGRKIVTDKKELANLSQSTSSSEIILMHEDFRMFVLANRPGFPFLGNDFFSSLGDVFSCHAVDNPSTQQELQMLAKYGPSVPMETLKKLVAAFGELRDMADRGLISYPYSTREVVNIVKHLQKFPDEGVASVVKNVFDFDAYKKESVEQLSSVMHKHGIPVGAKPNNVHLSKPLNISTPELSGLWNYNEKSQLCNVETRQLSIKGPVYLNSQPYEVEKIRHRGFDFTEQMSHFTLPQFYQSTIVSDMKTCNEEGENVLYVATVNPHALYRYDVNDSRVKMVDLYDILPSSSPMMQPRVKIAPMGKTLDGQVIVYDEKLKVMLLVNTMTGEVRRIHIPDVSSSVMSASKLLGWMTSSSENKSEGQVRMVDGLSPDSCSVLLYHREGKSILHFNVLDGTLNIVETPIEIENVQVLDADKWLVTENNEHHNLYLMETSSSTNLVPDSIRKIDVDNNYSEDTNKVQRAASKGLNFELLTKVLGQSIDSPNRVLVDDQSYAKCIVGLPDLMSPNEVYTFKRENPLPTNKSSVTSSNIYYRGLSKRVPADKQIEVLPNTCQVVRIVPGSYVPEESFGKGSKPINMDHCLEVTDMSHRVVRYIPLPQAITSSPYVSWQEGISDTGYLMTSSPDDLIYTCDTGGVIREWETGISNLRRSLTEWRHMIGSQDSRDHLQITREKSSGKDVTAPKHGKIDKDNTPHVGGNTWAGGTGGRDTAGLGGKGGPYRLDAGHDVTQIPDWEKEAVPEHVQQAAREMGEKAFKERLREIRMSEYDAHQYEEFSKEVRKQVNSLRIVLDSLQAKKKERHWVKHQTTGELDDMKLIEGLTGEKNIYKKRADEEPEPGMPQEKPKLMRIVVDVSGSMYRFNGVDQRLQRCMESACLVMEAFDGYKDKFKYEIWGHSGDGYEIEFASLDDPPKNDKERLKILKEMHAHAQFCMSGDHTLEATRFAVKEIKEQEGDEHFVIILSDANLQRYGISASQFADAMTSDDDVNTFAIFIGSLGDQADRLKRSLPSGRSFVCLETKDIPQIMQQIFTSSLLK